MEISKNTVIAAVRNTEELEAALTSKAEIIFDLCPNILTLGKVTENVHKAGKKVFIHLDLADGIGKDKSGIAYAKSIGIDGIISTRASIIKAAKDLGLFTVQRFFIVDSQSIETTIEALRTSKTDMVEIMPGVVPRAIEQLGKKLSVPIIAGGLIDSREDIEKAFCSGAVAVSTGKKELWSL
ncbi:MAG: glycerol-3-phosphate responsive antiterminator [Ruminococcaceae bacterium]|nr:glycerol-3-phosphate responsive antiterminator [Oscillospiraceae bacterium]